MCTRMEKARKERCVCLNPRAKECREEKKIYWKINNGIHLHVNCKMYKSVVDVKHALFFLSVFSFICLCIWCDESGETPKPWTIIWFNRYGCYVRSKQRACLGTPFPYTVLRVCFKNLSNSVTSWNVNIDRLKVNKCSSSHAIDGKTCE